MFEIELFWHLTVRKQNTILRLNWLVRNRTVYLYKSPYQRNNKASSKLYAWYGLQLFHQLFTTHRPPPIWSKDFELWFVSSKDFIPLFYCAPWPTWAFWHCFVSSTVMSWQQLCHIGQLHKVFTSQWILTHFFTTLDLLCNDVWSSQPPVTQAGDSDEIVLCIVKTGCI